MYISIIVCIYVGMYDVYIQTYVHMYVRIPIYIYARTRLYTGVNNTQA